MSSRLQRLLTCQLAVWALLLKAAVPLLAATAAQLQGLPVAQLCSIYGVATVQPSSAGNSPHVHHHAAAHENHDSVPGPAADHGHDHCALTAVAVMAVGHPPPALTTPSDDPSASPADRRGAFVVANDCARWVARLGHGPPTRA